MADKNVTATSGFRFSVGDRVKANGNAPPSYRGRNGIVTELGPDQTECRVEFEDGAVATTGYLRSSWLDPVEAR
ncbi:MAG TPA: hypothetical protein VGH34_15730 [Vicinamibacterales bacterium]